MLECVEIAELLYHKVCGKFKLIYFVKSTKLNLHVLSALLAFCVTCVSLCKFKCEENAIVSETMC